MSLSKVLKQHKLAEIQVTTFDFNTVSEGAVRKPKRREDYPFEAMVLEGFTAIAESPIEDEEQEGAIPAEAAVEVVEPVIEEVAPLPPGISEEELTLRMEEAYNQGLADGALRAGEELKGACKSMGAALKELNGLREKVLRESEEDLLKLSMVVAKKIVRQELTVDRRILANVIRAAVSGVGEREEIVIRLNPDDFKAVSANKKLFLGDEQATIKADEAVASGGCMIDTAMGVIDASIEDQLEEVYRRLLEGRGLVADGTDDESVIPEAAKAITEVTDAIVND
jgi:flagellar assembly protein FliH